jgi:ATP-binding cassette subfamily C protein
VKAGFATLTRQIRGPDGVSGVGLAIGASALVSLCEGLAMAALVPLLDALGIASASGSLIRSIAEQGFAALGLPYSTGTTLGLALSLLAACALFATIQAAICARIETDYAFVRQRRLFASLMHSEWGFVSRQKVGEVANALNMEVARAYTAFHFLLVLAANGFAILIYVVVAATAAWQVTAGALMLGAAAYVLLRPTLKRSFGHGAELSRASEAVQSRAVEFLGAAKLVKATASEPAAISDFVAAAERMRTVSRRSAFEVQSVRALLEFGGAAGVALVLFVCATLLGVDSASLLLIGTVVVRLFPKLVSLQQSLQAVQLYLPAVENLAQREAAAIAAGEPASSQELSLAPGPKRIEVCGLTVQLDGRPVLEDVDFRADAGSLVVVIGASGAGKSTLLECLVGFRLPSAGVVRIDDQNLAGLPLAAWRRSLGFVAQEPLVLDRPVDANLAWGRFDIGRPEMEAALRAAAATSLLDRLASTEPLGERGARLSGGERQRLTIARALIGRPGLLLLDEPTSALDADTEADIVRTLAHLRGAVTIVAVTHRPALCAVADAIYVLDRGRVVETGSFQELVAAKGRFADMWGAGQTGPLKAA